MKIVALSGGVGGARFLRAVADVVAPDDVTIVGNVGDDVEVLGLHVSPDLDSILYALTGRADEERGWGRADETWNALGLSAPGLFSPLYGPGGADRLRGHAARLRTPAADVSLPNLAPDVGPVRDPDPLRVRLRRRPRERPRPLGPRAAA